MDTTIITPQRNPSKAVNSKVSGKLPFIQIVPCNCHTCRGTGWTFSAAAILARTEGERSTLVDDGRDAWAEALSEWDDLTKAEQAEVYALAQREADVLEAVAA